jgi:hypothetical protein
MLSARYKPVMAHPTTFIPSDARHTFSDANVWLCGRLRCDGELARIAVLSLGPREVGYVPVLPFDFARDRQGRWRQSARPPRRPFQTGVDGAAIASYGVGSLDTPGKTLRFGVESVGESAPLVLVCPRCGWQSAVHQANLLASLRAYLAKEGATRRSPN